MPIRLTTSTVGLLTELAIYPGSGRKAGTWVVDFYDAAGVRHRYFRATKREASKLEEELRVEKWRQQREGLPLPELRDVTIAEYGERWLRESASRLRAVRSGATPDSFVCMWHRPLRR